MSGITMCVAAALLGINFGWEPAPDGGVVYIIQLQPGAPELDALRAGLPIGSDPPPEIEGVPIRRCQIEVGNRPLPRILPPKPAGNPRSPAVPPSDPFPRQNEQTPISKAVVPPWPATLTRPNVTPRPLPASPAKPLADKAVYEEPPSAKAETKPALTAPAAEPPQPARPWTTLSLVLLALFASLGGNVFLGWITLDLRNRCRGHSRLSLRESGGA